MGRKCASGPSFARVVTRAPIAPEAEEVVTKAVRDQRLHHEVAKLWPTWSAWIPRNVGFPFVNLMILRFHQKLDNEVLVGRPLAS